MYETLCAAHIMFNRDDAVLTEIFVCWKPLYVKFLYYEGYSINNLHNYIILLRKSEIYAL